MIELKQDVEKVILVAVSLQGQDDVDSSLDELSELAATAGAETVGRMIQSREAVHPGTYIGKGKIEELKDLIWQKINETPIKEIVHKPIEIQKTNKTSPTEINDFDEEEEINSFPNFDEFEWDD